MAEGDTRKITFHLIKTPGFTTHHADGAITRLTPQGYANLSFYVERWAIPQSYDQELTDEGLLGEVSNITGKDGVVREIQTGVMMDEAALRTLHQNLGELLREFEPEMNDETGSEQIDS
jgi:hypothetical protein